MADRKSNAALPRPLLPERHSSPASLALPPDAPRAGALHVRLRPRATRPCLSGTAIGIGGYIQSLPDGASVTIKALSLRFPEGAVTVGRVLSELEAGGYVVRRRVPLGVAASPRGRSSIIRGRRYEFRRTGATREPLSLSGCPRLRMSRRFPVRRWPSPPDRWAPQREREHRSRRNRPLPPWTSVASALSRRARALRRIGHRLATSGLAKLPGPTSRRESAVLGGIQDHRNYLSASVTAAEGFALSILLAQIPSALCQAPLPQLVRVPCLAK